MLDQERPVNRISNGRFRSSLLRLALAGSRSHFAKSSGRSGVERIGRETSGWDPLSGRKVAVVALSCSTLGSAEAGVDWQALRKVSEKEQSKTAGTVLIVPEKKVRQSLLGRSVIGKCAIQDLNL